MTMSEEYKPLKECMFDEIGYICDECYNEGVAWEQSKPNRLLYEREVRSAVMGARAKLLDELQIVEHEADPNCVCVGCGLFEEWFPVFFQDDDEVREYE